jgi:starvation-inducible DNA-binding protein
MISPILKIVDPENVSIGLSAENRSEIIQKLAPFLASTYVLYMKTLYYHWNVTGPTFHSLHEMFEEQYKNLQEAGDLLAERVRALGHKTPGSFAAFLKLSEVREDDSLPEQHDVMVRNLCDDNQMCSRQADDAIKVAESCQDYVTHDVLIERKAYHDKMSWMLRAHLE